MNALIRRGTARDFDLLRREMDRLFSDFSPAGGDRETVWAPRADVIETDDAYRITLDVPGVSQDGLDITFEDNTLKISGERTLAQTGEGTRVTRMERVHGRFFRSFTLGTDLDSDGIEADLADGVLVLRVPKAETAQPRRIEIRSRQLQGSDVEVHAN